VISPVAPVQMVKPKPLNSGKTPVVERESGAVKLNELIPSEKLSYVTDGVMNCSTRLGANGDATVNDPLMKSLVV
jgi:hypothetical protein